MKISKKGISLSIEVIVVFIIILVALTLILIFLFTQNKTLFNSLFGITNSTTALASETIIPKP